MLIAEAVLRQIMRNARSQMSVFVSALNTAILWGRVGIC